MSHEEKKDATAEELTAEQLENVAGGLTNADCTSYVKEPTSVEYPNFTVKKK